MARTIYSGGDTITKQDYELIMEVAKTLIIPIDGKHRIVDESEIVCRYRQLSYEADEAVPYSFLSTIMLNTKKRRLLHNQRVTLSWSIGVPNCERFN